MELINRQFRMKIGPNGAMTELGFLDDPYQANFLLSSHQEPWVPEEKQWGLAFVTVAGCKYPLQQCVSMEQSGNTITACYLLNFIENRFACVWDGDIAASKHEHCLEVRVSRSLLEYGVEESFQIKNTGRRHIAIDEIGWYTSFRDTYTTGDNALQTHMNQHIWMGGDLSYIEAERQSGEGPHMGMITLDGNFTSYQLEEVNTSNHRGMGLAILPGRLKKEMTDLKTALLNGENLRENDELAKHADWADEFMKRHPEFNAENAEDIIKFEIGQVFAQVLECAGVYKCTAEGRTALKRFLTEVQNG